MAKHQWRLDEDGDVDVWYMDQYIHNGPGCVRCHEAYCMHCWEVDSGKTFEELLDLDDCDG